MVNIPVPGGSSDDDSGDDSDGADGSTDSSGSSSPSGGDRRLQAAADQQDSSSSSSSSSSSGSSVDPPDTADRVRRTARRALDSQQSTSSSTGLQSGGNERMDIDEAPRKDAAEVNRATPDPRVERGPRRALDAEQGAVMETDDIRTRSKAAERFGDQREKERARQQIAEQNPEIDAGDIERLEATDDGAYQAELTDEARRDLAGPPAEPEGGPLDSDRVLNRTSPASQLFGLEEREQAIEAEAQQGSRSAQVFVGGESLEAAGVDASRAVDDVVPDPGFLEESQEIPLVTSFAPGATVDVNPKLGVGREGTRPAESVRNFVVEAPAGAGVVAGLGPRAVGDAGLRVEDALGRDVDTEAQATGSETVGGVESAGETVAEGARQDPVGTGLDLALPYAASKASPVRFRSRRIPLDADSAEGVDTTASVSRSRRAGAEFEARAQGSPGATDNVDLEATEPTPTETVTTVRLETPAALKPFIGPSRGRTVAGARGSRPTVGAPEVDPSRVDFGELPGRTRTFEPADPVRTDVFQATGRSAGGQTAARTEATRQLVSEAASESPGSRSVGSAEEIVEASRAAPSDKAPEIVDALDETDATIFGSAAARSQLDTFRQPRDIDVIVPDEQAARQRFDEALEGANADVDDVFDIKETGDAPGLARGGERIKFGRESFGKLQTDEGIPVNPVEEELVRKAGASGFFRPAGTAGTSRFDVGPEPRRAGRSDVRQKDPADAVALADEVLGPENAAVREFRDAFDEFEGVESPTAASPGPTDAGPGVRGLIADERGQLGLAGGGRRRSDALEESTEGTFDDLADSPTRSPADSPAGRDIGGSIDYPGLDASLKSLKDAPVTPAASSAIGAAADDSLIDESITDNIGSVPGFSSLSSESEFGDGGESSVAGPPVGSSSFSTGGSGGSSSAFGSGGFSGTSGGSGSSTSYGGGSGSSTSYGGGGGGGSDISSPPPGPPTNPPTAPPTTPPTAPPTNPPPGVPRRCPDSHTNNEDDQRVDDIAFGENEWPNPVAAPDELDDVADDVLGRNDPEGRNPTDDLLDDLPGDTDDKRDRFDPLGDFL